jgi:hypothetical protein
MDDQQDSETCKASERVTQPRGLHVGPGEPDLRVGPRGKAASAAIHGRGTSSQRPTQVDQKYGSKDSRTPEASE